MRQAWHEKNVAWSCEPLHLARTRRAARHGGPSCPGSPRRIPAVMATQLMTSWSWLSRAKATPHDLAIPAGELQRAKTPTLIGAACHDVPAMGARDAAPCAVAEIPPILAHGAKWKPRNGDRAYLHVLLAGTCHTTLGDDVLHQRSQVNLEPGGVRNTYTAAIMRTFASQAVRPLAPTS